MTAFYWVDTKQLAALDATEKGIEAGEWAWFDSKDALDVGSPLSYQAVYLRTGLIELERAFAKIMQENRPKWLC